MDRSCPAVAGKMPASFAIVIVVWFAAMPPLIVLVSDRRRQNQIAQPQDRHGQQRDCDDSNEHVPPLFASRFEERRSDPDRGFRASSTAADWCLAASESGSAILMDGASQHSWRAHDLGQANCKTLQNCKD